MKIIALAAVAALAVAPTASFAQPGSANPTATHSNPSSCLGAERATRNSNTGDRAQGGFGDAQSAYVASLNAGGTMSYGEFLQTWKDACENAPGTTGANADDTNG
jgi:hypothetical protein